MRCIYSPIIHVDQWSNSHGLAYTAGEAFMFANKPLGEVICS